jgi:tetratricopeptide (TPR) repeat protein
MDAAAVKQVLASNDVSEIRAAADQFSNYVSEDLNQQRQIFKLLILLYSRILQLQQPQNGSTASFTDSDRAETHFAIASAWNGMGDITKAKGQLKKSIELNGSDWKAYELLGEVEETCSNHEVAIENFEKAIELLQKQDLAASPTLGIAFAACYSKLARIHERKGEFQQGVNILQKAIDLLPAGIDPAASAMLYGHMGEIWHETGEYAKAVQPLTTAVELYKNSDRYGANHSRTQEIEYLMEMATSMQ